MEEEYESLIKMGTWKLVDRPENSRPISCKWVFTIKRDSTGGPIKCKARCVARGFTQRNGIDYDETFSPVVKFTSIRVFLALAASLSLKVYQLDVKTAYLNGEIDKQIFMTQPDGFDDQSGRVLELLKAIYGLKQASCAWSKKLNQVLISLGFKRLESDHSVFIFRRQLSLIIIPAYVNNLMGATNDDAAWEELKTGLRSHFEISDKGRVEYCLGISINQDLNKKTIRIHQQQHIIDVLQEFQMSDCNPAKTPLPPNIHLSTEMSPTTREEQATMKNIPYLRLVGRLMYLMLFTRPDICHAVGVLSRFSTNPGWQHWLAAKHLLRYLKGTSHLGLTYDGNKPLTLKVWTDADWAEDRDTRRSTTGWIATVGGTAVSWSSKQQPTVAQSTLQAEYQAGATACREVVWLRQLLTEFQQPPPSPTILFCDNQGAITTSKDPAHHDKTKHIAIKYHFIRECVDEKVIDLTYTPTTQMAADFLTKSLPVAKLEVCRSMVGIC